MAFTKNSKNSAEKVNMAYLPVEIKATADEFIIKDKFDNYESVSIENGSLADGDYELAINLFDIKLVVDSCKADHITFNCGNHRSVVITRGPVSNLIPELRRA